VLCLLFRCRYSYPVFVHKLHISLTTVPVLTSPSNSPSHSYKCTLFLRRLLFSKSKFPFSPSSPPNHPNPTTSPTNNSTPSPSSLAYPSAPSRTQSALPPLSRKSPSSPSQSGIICLRLSLLEDRGSAGPPLLGAWIGASCCLFQLAISPSLCVFRF